MTKTLSEYAHRNLDDIIDWPGREHASPTDSLNQSRPERERSSLSPMVTLPHTYAYEHLNISNNSSTRPCAAAETCPLSPRASLAAAAMLDHPEGSPSPAERSHSDVCACLVRAQEGSPINVRGCCGAVGR